MSNQMMRLVIVLLALPLLIDSARILAVIPMPSKSHHYVVHALLRGLSSRGHHITALEFFQPSKMPPNYTHVALDDSAFQQRKERNPMWEMTSMNYFFRVIMLWNLGSLLLEKTFQQPNVQEIINSKDEHFDLVIVDAFFNEGFLGLGHKFKCPVVQICPYVGSYWMYEAVGSPSPSSYVPDPFLSYRDHMTLTQRIFNGIFGVFQTLGRELYFMPYQDSIMRKELHMPDLPHLNEIHRNTSLMLINSHISLNYPRPLTPNLIPVGGMHIEPPKDLPLDLKNYIDESKDGVIYFSMGSALQSSEMPENKFKTLLEVFSTLQQRILWKWENNTLPGQPENIKIRKWFPQADILAHPNVRVFITHGGLLSSFEAIYHGVPIIGIPIFGDQQLNMEKAEASGYGLKIDFEDLCTENLQNAVHKVLNDKSYKENARFLSKLLHDEPETPLERAVWWIEYVLRHKGAPHLKSAVQNLSWYQHYQLDVILIVGVLVSFVIFVFIEAFKFLQTLFISKSVPKKVQRHYSKKQK